MPPVTKVTTELGLKFTEFAYTKANEEHSSPGRKGSKETVHKYLQRTGRRAPKKQRANRATLLEKKQPRKKISGKKENEGSF